MLNQTHPNVVPKLPMTNKPYDFNPKNKKYVENEEKIIMPKRNIPKDDILPSVISPTFVQNNNENKNIVTKPKTANANTNSNDNNNSQRNNSNTNGTIRSERANTAKYVPRILNKKILPLDNKDGNFEGGIISINKRIKNDAFLPYYNKNV